MNPIYYKSRKSGELFMLEIMTEEQEQIDSFLDQMNACVDVYVTADDFSLAYENYMTIDVYDTSNTFKTGELTLKYMDLDDDTVIE